MLAGSPGVRRRDLLQHVAGVLLAALHAGPAGSPARAEPRRLEQALQHLRGDHPHQARNFSYGIRLLPRDQRAALCAVYALARRIDDIGDGDLRRPRPAEARAALAGVRASVATLAAGSDGGDPVLVAVADAARRYPIPLGAFGELIDGVERDVDMDVTGRGYADFDELVGVLPLRRRRRSAGCAWACSAARPDPARAPATPTRSASPCSRPTSCATSARTSLNGRVYLPQDDSTASASTLRLDGRRGWPTTDGALARPASGSPAERARTWYDDGLRLLPLLDRRSAACCRHGRHLPAAARPDRGRPGAPSATGGCRCPAGEKAAVAARALTGRTR